MKRKTLIKYGLTVVAASVALIGRDIAAQTQNKKPNTRTMTPGVTGSAASAPTKEKQASMTPQSALAELKEGNGRFVAGNPLKRNLAGDVKTTASGQYPFAVVLSCIDS